MEDMDKAVKHVYELASFAKLDSEADTKRRADDKLLALIGSSEESTTKFPCYQFPPVDSQFFGRAKELKSIKDALAPDNERNALRSFAIYGLGGIGKSTLALAYAEQCKREDIYDAVFWVRSENLADLRDSFTDIALRLELFRASDNADSDSNVILVKNWLGKTGTSGT